MQSTLKRNVMQISEMDNSEVLGTYFYYNYGSSFYIPITVADFKLYFPREYWYLTASQAYQAYINEVPN